MRYRLLSPRVAFIAALLVTAASCSDAPFTTPASNAPDVPAAQRTISAADGTGPRFSEIHYDNAGTDVGEAIEVAGPAGMDLTGWSVVLYNGSGGALYGTTNLSGTIPATCGSRGVVVVNYPSNGLQNGSPDGFALVNAAGAVVEFLSYEGTFAAVGGPADGMVSTDIGVAETSTTAIGESLQRVDATTWLGPVAATWSACNDDAPVVANPVAAVSLSPTTASIPAGSSVTFVATAADADGNPTSSSFAFASVDAAVATVDAATGLATGVAAGTTEITAASANGIVGRATLTVTLGGGSGTAWINEIHYDNNGADVDEGVEVAGPAGTDLTGWSVVLYNGNGGAPYSTTSLSGAIPATCGEEGVIVADISGMQNGSPDGVALVNAAGVAVEFLSYEGTLAAVGGPANGQTSRDVGVAEAGTEPAGQSLQRVAADTWQGPMPATFGACNGAAAPPPPPAAPGIVINELLGDPLSASGGPSWGEWFEVHNTSAAAINLNGWSIASGGQAAHLINRDVLVPAGGFAIIGRGYDPARNGGVTLDYNYFAGSTTIWLDDSDWLSLRDPAGATADSVAWTSLPKGVSVGVRDATRDNLTVNASNWGYSTTRFGDGDFGTPGAFNAGLSDTPPSLGEPGVVARIVLSRFDGDFWVPAGYQKPIFATAYDGPGNTVGGVSYTWTSSDASIASVDGLGYVTGIREGTVVVTATSVNGVQATRQFTIRPGSLPTSANYRDHLGFGIPEDGSPTDDYLIVKPQFALSYSTTRGGPNWVAWNLNASQFGPEDRCDCFTPDPELPAGMVPVTDADYRGSGYSRGHMVMSKNRTTTGVENAATFLMTNILPQSTNNNSGPWLKFELFLNGLAENQNREIYIFAGGDYSANPQTLNGAGKVQVPEFTWKVAVVMDAGQGLDNVTSWDDLKVYAIRTPNDTLLARDIRGDEWTQHETTVDAIEAITGYNFLDKLPDLVERVVESGTRFPVAVAGGPYTGAEGAAVRLDASASSDPDGDAITFHWNFGDGATGTGAVAEHVYGDNGVYQVTLTVSDVYGASSTAAATVTVANIGPAVAAFAGATLLPGETYTASGTFTDPGADQWTATVNFGDGSGMQPLERAGNTFGLEHRYAAAGTFAVTVAVADDDGGRGENTATVVVRTAGKGVETLVSEVDSLLAVGLLDRGNANALHASLRAAAAQIGRGNFTPAVNQLNAFTEKAKAFADAGKLPASRAAEMVAYAERIIRSLR